MLYLILSELLLDPVPMELLALKLLTSDGLFVKSLVFKLVSAWYPLESALKLLTSDSLFVTSFVFTNIWRAGRCFGNGDKTLWGSMKVSGIILK